MKMDQPNDTPPPDAAEQISSRLETDPMVWLSRFDALRTKLTELSGDRELKKLLKEFDAKQVAEGRNTFDKMYDALRESVQRIEDGEDEFNDDPAVIETLEAVLKAYQEWIKEIQNNSDAILPDGEAGVANEAPLNAAGTARMEKLRSNTVTEGEEKTKAGSRRRQERRALRGAKEAELGGVKAEDGDATLDTPPADKEDAVNETLEGRKEALVWITYLETIAQVAEGLAEMEGIKSQMASQIRSIANDINPDAFTGNDERHTKGRLSRLRRDMLHHLTHFGNDLMDRYGSKGELIQISGEILLGKLGNPNTPDHELTDAFEKFKKAVEETKAEQEATANLPAVHESIDQARQDWREYADILSEYADVAGIRSQDFKVELAEFKEAIERSNLSDDDKIKYLDAKIAYFHAHLLAALTARSERFAKRDAQKMERCKDALRTIEMLFADLHTTNAGSFDLLREALNEFVDTITPERERNLTKLEAVLKEIEPRIKRLEELLRILKTANPEAYDALCEHIMDVDAVAQDEEQIPDPFVWAQLLDETGTQIHHLHINLKAVKDEDDAMVTKILGNAETTKEILDGLLQEYTPMAGNVILGEAEEIPPKYDREAASDSTPEEEDAQNQYAYQAGDEARREGAGSRTSRLEGEKAQAFADLIASAATLDEYRAAIDTLDANGVRAKKVSFTPSGIIYSINQLEGLIQNDRARFEQHRNNLSALMGEMTRNNGPLSFVPEKWGMRRKLAELLAREHGLLSEKTAQAEEEIIFTGTLGDESPNDVLPAARAEENAIKASVDSPIAALPNASIEPSAEPSAEKYEFVGGWDSPEKTPHLTFTNLSAENARELDKTYGVADIADPLQKGEGAPAPAETATETTKPATERVRDDIRIKESYREKLKEARKAAEGADTDYRNFLEKTQKRTKMQRILGIFGTNRKIERELEEKRHIFEILENKFHALTHEQAQKRINILSGIRMRKSPEERAVGKAAKGTTERDRVRKVQERYRGLVFTKSVMPVWEEQRKAENAALAAEMSKSKDEVLKAFGRKGWRQYAKNALVGSLLGMGGRAGVAAVAGTNPLGLALLGGAIAGSVARQGVMWAGERAEEKYIGRAYDEAAKKKHLARAVYVQDPGDVNESRKFANESIEVFTANKRKARTARVVKNVAKYAAPIGAGAAVGAIADMGSDRAGEIIKDGLSAPEVPSSTGDAMGGDMPEARPVGTDELNSPESIRAPYQSYSDSKGVPGYGYVDNIMLDQDEAPIDLADVPLNSESISSELAWEVSKGDTVWEKLDDVVARHYPDMDETQRLKFVDTLENILREKHGDSIDHLAVGQKLDFSDDLPPSTFAEIADRIIEGKASGSVDIEPSVESAEPVHEVPVAEPVEPGASVVEAAGIEGEEIRAAMLADLENHSVSSEAWNGGFEGRPLKTVDAGEFGQRMSRPFGMFGIKADLEPIGKREDIPLDTVFNTRNTGVLSHTYEMLEERAKTAGVNLDEYLAAKAGSGTTLEAVHAELVERSLSNVEEAPVAAESAPDWAQTTNTQELVEEWEHLKYEPKTFGSWAHIVVDRASEDVEELVEAEDAASWARHYVARFNTEMLVPRSEGVIEESGYRGVMLRNLSGENIPGLRKEAAVMRSLLEYVNNKYDGIPGYQKYADELTTIDKMLARAASVGGRLDAEAMRTYLRRR